MRKLSDQIAEMDENEPIEKLRKEFERNIEAFFQMHVSNYSDGPQRLELDILLLSTINEALKKGGGDLASIGETLTR